MSVSALKVKRHRALLPYKPPTTWTNPAYTVIQPTQPKPTEPTNLTSQQTNQPPGSQPSTDEELARTVEQIEAMQGSVDLEAVIASRYLPELAIQLLEEEKAEKEKAGKEKAEKEKAEKENDEN